MSSVTIYKVAQLNNMLCPHAQWQSHQVKAKKVRMIPSRIREMRLQIKQKMVGRKSDICQENSTLQLESLGIQ